MQDKVAIKVIPLFFYTEKPKDNRMVCICGSM